jgi:hypothetical protein
MFDFCSFEAARNHKRSEKREPNAEVKEEVPQLGGQKKMQGVREYLLEARSRHAGSKMFKKLSRSGKRG